MPDVVGVVIKTRTGAITGPARDQKGALLYLTNVVAQAEQAALQKVLTEMFNGGGKATSDYVEDGRPVWHISKGKKSAANLSVFYTVDDHDVAMVIAIGHHVPNSKPTAYRVDVYGQPEGSFTWNAEIELD